MNINTFVEGFKSLKEYREIEYSLKKGLNPTAIHGLVESQIAHMAFSLNYIHNRQSLIITHSQSQSKNILDDLNFFSQGRALHFPAKEIMFYNFDAYSHQTVEERIKAIIHIASGKPCLVVASVESLLTPLMPRALFVKKTPKIVYGEDINLEALIDSFINLGYERVDQVEAKGQFSLRGGIIDVFSMDSVHPYRVELFDNEVDSIRTFDMETQLSLQKLKEVTIFPAKEVLIGKDRIENSIASLKDELSSISSKLSSKAKNHLEEKINELIEGLKTSTVGQSIENYLNYLYPRTNLLTSYFNEDLIVFVDEPSRVRGRAETAFKEFEESFKALLEKGEVLPKQAQLMVNYDFLLKELEKYQLFTVSTLPKNNPSFSPKHIINFTSRMTQSFHSKLDLLADELKQWKYRGFKIILLCGNQERARHLESNLKDMDVEVKYLEKPDQPIMTGQTFIMTGNLGKGFEYYNSKFVVLAENEIFGVSKRKRTPSKRKDARPIKSFTDLKPGDYVVHENHGIGKYIGIEQLKVQGSKKDYLKLKYSDEGILYVPIEQMDIVQKYIGADDGSPKLNKLGGAEWKKVKSRVKGAIVDMAKDLLRLNALRQTTKGFAFSQDSPWQVQFEDMFPFQETPDQLRCIKEIKEDMEKSIPMDRLLCGDVGYGKTEVAIRAAFKCVVDGKQVAILVPTTILAQQHYNTFIERFQHFPISIEMLSRFRTDKQQKEIINGLRAGNMDIIIGTHRMLSKDIQFKDLGMLIIDEEQRFGVQHKEALKQLRQNVDVLTLTATPIPRTLHMSMIGLRDMSIIEDPPEERYPVQTYVTEFHEEIIKDAIAREIYRGGQVYFVFNRVKGIQQMAAKIRKLLPEARVAVGHGQMSERDLENIMLDFMNGEYDILVCTTIIETGLDISNVNTIIIHDADKMGLSQLYQLRGRVGRSNRLAYAYLTYQKNKILTEVAEKRLKAIKEFTEFGSGFKIAMRDLEIRGAGNLLGAEQHGHMAAIGYDLYVKLLEDTVAEMKGQKVERDIETTIEIDINAFIPKGYIESESQKLVIYKRIASIRDQQDMDDIQEEIEDRFGTIPDAVLNLISIAYIKSLAQKAGISNVTENNGFVKLQFANADKINPMAIKALIKAHGNNLRVNAGATPFIQYRYNNTDNNFRSKELQEILEKISGFHAL